VKKITVTLVLTLLMGMFSIRAFSGQQKLGLVIIAHGSPKPEWNAPVLELEREVLEILNQTGNNPFTEVRVALMEFNQPSINSVMEDLEKKGIDRVYAIPLLIAPSGHSLFDVPTILGMYHDRDIVQDIKAEGTTIVDTKIKVTLGPTLDSGNVLREIMLDRVEELSTAPESEGVVLLAHGDHSFEPIWSSLCSKIGSFICARTGMERFDYAYVEVGQGFIAEGIPAILRMEEKCDKTIVVGLYLSMGVERMANNSVLSIGMMKMGSEEILKDKNIEFSKRGLLPDKRISEWIIGKALNWAED
jgi:sirohydrochlorin ferrochelatase